MNAFLRRKDKSKNKYLNRYVISVIVLSLIVVSTLFLLNSPALKVKKINIQGDQISCANFTQIKEVISKIEGNLLFLDGKKVRDELKENFICIGNIEIQKKFPDELKVQIFKREPIALFLEITSRDASSSSTLVDIVESTASAIPLDRLSSNQAFLIDKEGTLFEKSPGNISKPNIYLNEELTFGQIFSSDLIDGIVKIFQKLELLRMPSGQIIIIDRRILVYYTDIKILFNLDETLETQLASLQLILEKAKINSDNAIEFIDLRFDKPVVRYGQGQNNLRN